MPTISFEPLISWALWLALAVACAAMLTWYGWRRPAGVLPYRWRRVMVLMAGGMAVVLLMLLNPTLMTPVGGPPGKPLVTVALDMSGSMATPDAENGRTRHQAAVAWLREFADTAAGDFDVRVLAFAGTTTAVDLETLAQREPDGQATDLHAAVNEALATQQAHGQMLVMLSDGIDNAHQPGGASAELLKTARAAKALASPIFTHTFGGQHVTKDLAVELRSPYELTFAGRKTPVVAVVKQQGLAGTRAKVGLHQEGNVLQSREVDLGDDASVEAAFEVEQGRTGQHRYEVRVEPAPGEVSLVNNAAPLVVRVIDQPIRVLVLEGKPYWDGKFLLRTLAADPSIELDSVVRMSEGRFYQRTLTRTAAEEKRAKQEPIKQESVKQELTKQESTKQERAKQKGPEQGAGAEASVTAATTAGQRESWKVLSDFSEFAGGKPGLGAFQVIVLGRDAEAFLTDDLLGRLRAWLAEDGGALVCYRGQPVAQLSERLAQLLPVRWAPQREARLQWRLTERGRDLRWFAASDAEAFAGLPSLASVSLPEGPRPLGVVLATAGPGAGAGAESNPVVTYQPFGLGRVVTIEGSGMWRWAFLPPQQKKHDHVYGGLWHNLMRWLVSSATLLPGQKLALRTDKVRFSPNEAVTATLLMRMENGSAKPPDIELRGSALESPRRVTPAPSEDDPGAWRANFGRLREGRYLARVLGAEVGSDSGAGSADDASAVFDVRSLSDEHLDLRARPDVMAWLAQESGGAALTGSSPGEAVDLLRAQLARQRTEQVSRLPLWDRWWFLVAVLGFWGLTWGVRRAGGLI